jgi:hypothetical protein
MSRLAAHVLEPGHDAALRQLDVPVVMHTVLASLGDGTEARWSRLRRAPDKA